MTTHSVAIRRILRISIIVILQFQSCQSFIQRSSRSCSDSNRLGSSIRRTNLKIPLFFGINNDNNNNNLQQPVEAVEVEPLLMESPHTNIITTNVELLPTVPVLLGVFAFTAFWPLLAYLRFENPRLGVEYFQIDTFLALQGIMGLHQNLLQDPASSSAIATEIIELPGMSPAEQVVAAFFGPP